jgi:hypothetical protein
MCSGVPVTAKWPRISAPVSALWFGARSGARSRALTHESTGIARAVQANAGIPIDTRSAIARTASNICV